METRKVQVTGGSTYTVSLPKEWATENDVSAGSVVDFHAERDRCGALHSATTAASTGVSTSRDSKTGTNSRER